MSIVARQFELHILNMHTRFPFRYGITAMTALPHLLMRVTLEIDGQPCIGYAADGLPPKWFTKDPHTAYRDDVADMLAIIKQACTFAQQVVDAQTVFDLWQQVYAAQKQWAADTYPPLLWNFGVSLVERAIIDAFCKATNTTFAQALRTNTLGLRLGEIHPTLADYAPADLLPTFTPAAITARHTVGLSDPLTDATIPAEDRVDDGLPHSLEACIQTYGLTHFKLKIGGNLTEDVARLQQIAAVIDRAGVKGFAFTLDGNEQYKTVESFKAFWQQLSRNPSLADFLEHLLFVEQPLHRSVALNNKTKIALNNWAERPPMIIDESDGSIESLPTALASGYIGTSHKNCKGIFKGIANACLIEQCRRNDPDTYYVLSGEDLTNVGPIALLQDLAVVATLGVTHVERNGHHYFAGLSMYPQSVQQQILAQHGDLYHQHAAGFAALTIQDGKISLETINQSPFGVGISLNFADFTPVNQWQFESLG